MPLNNFIISLLYWFLGRNVNFFFFVDVKESTFTADFAMIVFLFKFRKSINTCWNLFYTILIHISVDVVRCLGLMLLILLLNDIFTTVSIYNQGMITLLRSPGSLAVLEVVERNFTLAAISEILRVH